MRMGLCALLCLAVVTPSVVAQPLDKAKLRQAIEMPAISSFLGVRFSSSERDSRGKKFNAVDKIADLQKKLTGGPEDAQIYLDLRVVYLDNLKDEKKGREMADKAEAVLRPYRETTDPKHAYLVTIYATLVEILKDNPWGDCEKWARRAVSVGPQDWRTWTYLARSRHQQIPTILMGGDDKLLPPIRRTQEVIGALHTRRLRPEHVDAAEKVLNEALQYHDKARDLAPNEPLRQEQRYGFRLTEIVLRNAICAYRSQKPIYPMVQLERTLLDELQATARLHPDHLLWQSQLIHHLTIVGWQQEKDKDGRPVPTKKFRPARPEDAVAIREALARIDRLIDDGKGETAIFCHTLAATLCASMQDYASVERHARLVLQADDKNQIAYEQLEHALFNQERYADMLQVVQVLAQKLPSARNSYVLAKALAKNQHYDLAEKECKTGLDTDKTEPHCMLGLAVLLMRKGDDAQTVQLAGAMLANARRECRPESGASLYDEVEYVTAIHQALSGDAAFARLKLDRLWSDHPDTPRYENALNALGR